MQWIETIKPEDYKAEIVHPATIKPRNDGYRHPDYYPRRAGWSYPRHKLAAAILEGKRELYKDIIAGYIRQCEICESVEVVPEDCYVYDEDDEGFWIIPNEWASEWIWIWQDWDSLPHTFRDGTSIPEAKSVEELITLMQRIGQEYPHWMMELACIVLSHADFVRIRVPDCWRYDLRDWEWVTAVKYFQELAANPPPPLQPIVMGSGEKLPSSISVFPR